VIYGSRIHCWTAAVPGARLALALALLALWCAAAAQPYAAGGGFGRPVQLSRTSTGTSIALVATGDGATLYWSDRDGIMRGSPLGERAPERVVEARGMRELAAAEVHGDVALAWAYRDLTTGRTSHWLRWHGQDRLLLDTLQAYELSLVAAPAGPAVLLARREGSETVLRMIAWDGSETVVARSDESVVRYRGVYGDDGVARVIWLEGFTDRSAIGFSAAEWTAYLAEVGPGGPRGQPLRLGPARYRGAESRTSLALAGDRALALWPGPNGEVLFTASGEEPRQLGQGVPVGLAGGEAYWAEGSSIKRADPLAGGGAVNVAWSPVTVQRGELAAAGGQLFLAWYGPTRGGDFELYWADDREPLRPDLRDRMAAAMGWSPWGFWEAMFAQFVGSLFAGVLLSMAFSPLLWLAAAIATRTRLSRRPTEAGMILAAGLLATALAVAALHSRLPAAAHADLFGTVPELAVAFLFAGALTWWLRRNSDSELLIGVLSSGWLFLFLGTSLLAFQTFQSWLAFWSATF
jgi:hypothetical protein